MVQPRTARIFGIGELSRRSGVAVANIRYYEAIGLLPKPGRSAAGQRRYGADDLARIEAVKRCRTLGFSLEETREMIALASSPDRSCADARDLAAERLEAVRRQIAEYRAMEAELARRVEDCEASCLGGPAPQCCVVAPPPAARR